MQRINRRVGTARWRDAQANKRMRTDHKKLAQLRAKKHKALKHLQILTRIAKTAEAHFRDTQRSSKRAIVEASKLRKASKLAQKQLRQTELAMKATTENNK